ncbi:TPA: response regulator transcription factor [Serratia liquefaciens]|nr:response regulator transcription factor [Serratia liquefaciens]
MKTHLDIVILDTNRFFAIGLEAILKPYLLRRGYPPAFFSDSYDGKADLVFRSQGMSATMLCCCADSSLPQYRIAIQEPTLPRVRLSDCFREQSTISRRIGVEALLAEVDMLLAFPAIPNQNCPRCVPTLSVRELQILRALNGELTPKQIAKELRLSIKTVSAHKCAAMEKLGFTRNTELYHWLRQGGLENKQAKINDSKSTSCQQSTN